MTPAIRPAVLLAILVLAACGRKEAAPAAAPSPAAPTPSVAASAPAGPAGSSVYRELKNWIVACDNVRRCELKAVVDEAATDADAASGAIFSITRDAGPNAPVTVSLSADPASGVDPARFTLDGKPLAPVAGWTSDADEGRTLQGAAALAFLRMLHDGKRLTLGSGKDAPAASLDGLAAVELAADEAQGRIGTADALSKAGARPAASAAPAPSLPVVTRAAVPMALPAAARFAAAVRASHKAELEAAGCDRTDPAGDEAHALSASEAVVLLDCTMAAYQGSELVFRAPRDAPAKAKLLITPGDPAGVSTDSKPGDGQIMNAGFEPKTLTLSEGAKGRGIGDCGDSHEWTFDGRAFVLTGATRQERCGGGTADWPTVWRAQVRGP